ncbi:hypothetical protein BGW38_010355 [Lunasporangiospora selenospora]|uniref:PQ loop repeat protein n=1 Tax=Lunasporangiospora selenospora TaxID=979761 RepID=A0A9P6G384_9FUNG|nr:hypothetical protein BGW38_010355 [Lunasporangiospora selenospora]
MFGLVLVLFIIYFPANKKNAGSGNRHPQFSFLPDPSDEWALSLLIARFVGVQLAVCVFITILMLAFVGPDSQWTSLWASLLGITSVILATIQYVPQIMRTYRRKSVGALSIPMMLMQTPGAALLTLSLALRPGANWTTWIVYAVTGCLQGILLVMCIYYHFNATKQGYGDFDTAETEPLLAENHIVPNLHLPHPHRDQHQNSAHGTPASG